MNDVQDRRLTVHLNEEPIYDIVLTDSFCNLETELKNLGCDGLQCESSISGFRESDCGKMCKKCELLCDPGR